MATPVTTQVRLPLRHFVKCPLGTTWIARDRITWQIHMQSVHSGVAGTWADTGIRGSLIGMTGIRNFRDGTRIAHYAPTCYGCGAVFETNAELIAHLLAVHGAS